LFAKEVMQAGGVPTAEARRFSVAAEARAYIAKHGMPVVIKADGLAAGKGVYVCAEAAEAESAVQDILEKRVFGDAGNQLLVEDCLVGEEASILARVDGSHIVMLASSQDHKRVFNGDRGPNTGGMGAYSPAPVIRDEMWPVIRSEVFERTLAELRKRGITYKGILYAGLMITSRGPRVLEFNCRFGDPETQAILPRIDGDLLPALQACVDGTLNASLLRWKPESCVCVVMASGGYPGPYQKGKQVLGLAAAAELEDVVVFHAGTTIAGDGAVVTSGGRVLGVTALGGNLSAAVKQAYRTVSKLEFDQAQYRTDIGRKALNR
jgi:phosphoribosylamine--glycine ligase